MIQKTDSKNWFKKMFLWFYVIQKWFNIKNKKKPLNKKIQKILKIKFEKIGYPNLIGWR